VKWAQGSGGLILTLALLASAGASQRPDTSTKKVVEAAARYVADYQRQLTSVIADETYTQEIVAQTPRDPQMPRLRRTQSEVFFAYLTTDRHWMAIRDVISLDGTALTDRPDLRGAFQKLAAGDVPPKFTEVNSRYNIGRTFRNFNEPTLALLVLDERHRARFSFERKGVEREGNSTLVTIAFTEKDPPTLIQHQRRGRVFSRGEFIVEAGTGRVRRTLLTAKTDALRLELTTTYGPNDRLGMSVPTLFREHYEYGSNATKPFSDPAYERVVCEAQYSNFRRFETSVRIK
jgi:hypothetical protein